MKKIITALLLSLFSLSSILAMEEETIIEPPKQVAMKYKKKSNIKKICIGAMVAATDSYCHSTCDPTVCSCGPQVIGAIGKWTVEYLYMPKNMDNNEKASCDCMCGIGFAVIGSAFRLYSCDLLGIVCDGVVLASAADIAHTIVKTSPNTHSQKTKKEN